MKLYLSNTRASVFFNRCITFFYRANSGLIKTFGLLILSAALSTISTSVYAVATWEMTLVRVSGSPVDSGTEVFYELQMQCSAVAEPSCDDTQITLDIPDDLLGILTLDVADNPVVDTVTPTATGAVVDLISPFPAGATSSVVFTIASPNGAH